MKSIRKLEDAYKATDIAYWAAWRAVCNIARSNPTAPGPHDPAAQALLDAMDEYKWARRRRDVAWTRLEERLQIAAANRVANGGER